MNLEIWQWLIATSTVEASGYKLCYSMLQVIVFTVEEISLYGIIISNQYSVLTSEHEAWLQPEKGFLNIPSEFDVCTT